MKSYANHGNFVTICPHKYLILAPELWSLTDEHVFSYSSPLLKLSNWAQFKGERSVPNRTSFIKEGLESFSMCRLWLSDLYPIPATDLSKDHKLSKDSVKLSVCATNHWARTLYAQQGHLTFRISVVIGPRWVLRSLVTSALSLYFGMVSLKSWSMVRLWSVKCAHSNLFYTHVMPPHKYPLSM